MPVCCTTLNKSNQPTNQLRVHDIPIGAQEPGKSDNYDTRLQRSTTVSVIPGIRNLDSGELTLLARRTFDSCIRHWLDCQCNLIEICLDGRDIPSVFRCLIFIGVFDCERPYTLRSV